MRGRLHAAVIAYALSMCIGLSTVAFAGSLTQPDETVGVPAGAPLPEGLDFANTADWGCRNTIPPAATASRFPLLPGRRLGRFSAQGCSFSQ
jgi:hypothetical protein